MADRLSPDSEAGGGPKLIDRLQTQLLPTEKDRMKFTVGRAEVNQFVDIIQNSGFTQDSAGDQARRAG